MLTSLQVIDVSAQARGEAYNFIHRMYALEGNRHSVTFEVFPKGDYFELYYNGLAFACLDKAFCSKARQLVGLGVRLQACLEQKRWEEVTRAWKPYTSQSVTFSVDVNVKSLIHHADKVGNILLDSGVFLQRPSQNPGEEIYYNPQILQIEGFCERPDEMMAEAEDASTPTLIPDQPSESNPKPSTSTQDHVEQILDSLTHTNVLHEIRTDTNRIKSTLMG